MLVIREAQNKAFEDDALRRFKEEMVEHSKEFSPQLCDVLGEQQLRVAVSQAMQRADEYGFTNRGSIRLYIEMMFLFGSDFDSDPQYPLFGEILKKEDGQMQRAEALYSVTNNYLDQVAGPDARYVHQALKELPSFAYEPLVFSSETLVEEMLRKMNHMYPRKARYVGNEGLTTLIYEGRDKAQEYHSPATTSRGEVLLIVLMFSFGHGCTNDPLYPWISHTLNDALIVDSVARFKRLEKKALTWLSHVLGKPRTQS